MHYMCNYSYDQLLRIFVLSFLSRPLNVTYYCRKLWRCDNESHKARALTHVETSHKAECCGEESQTTRGLVPNLPHPRINKTKQQCSQVCQAKARLVWDILDLGFFVWGLVVFLARKDDLLFVGNTHCRQSYRHRSRFVTFVGSIVKQLSTIVLILSDNPIHFVSSWLFRCREPWDTLYALCVCLQSTQRTFFVRVVIKLQIDSNIIGCCS